MRKLLLLLLAFLPSVFKVLIYRGILGWKIGKNVKIGLSYIDSEKVEIGNDVTIGHFNIFQRILDLQVGARTYIRSFNQFSGGGYEIESGWTRRLYLGGGVLIMNNHFIDIGGTVEIGNRTTLAGRDTHIWSHTMSYENNNLSLIPLNVEIGEEVYVGARSTILFCKVPSRAVIGAGSIVNKSLETNGGRVLIAGNPAIVKKYYT
jgi:acetyltransferase-like isoleucine patch superfamily enzyme